MGPPAEWLSTVDQRHPVDIWGLHDKLSFHTCSARLLEVRTETWRNDLDFYSAPPYPRALAQAVLYAWNVLPLNTSSTHPHCPPVQILPSSRISSNTSGSTKSSLTTLARNNLSLHSTAMGLCLSFLAPKTHTTLLQQFVYLVSTVALRENFGLQNCVVFLLKPSLQCLQQWHKQKQLHPALFFLLPPLLLL